MSKKDNTIPKGYKPSPLGPIPKDWELKRLEEFGSFKGGGTPSKERLEFWRDGTIPWVSPKDMKVLEIVKTEDYITEQAIKESSTNLIKTNSILIVNRSGILRNFVPVALNKIPVTINQDLKALTVKKANSYRFVFSALLGFNNRLLFESAKDGTTVESLDFDSIKKFKIATPPLKEQTAIANLLSTWDKAINTFTQLIAQKEQRKKWLMQQLLTGKKKLKGFKGEWREYHLRDFFDERNETNYVSLRLLSIGQSGVYPQTDSDKKDNSNEDKSKYRRICKGDIGYNTMRMWQGRSALSTMEGIVSPAYTILKPKKNADSLFFSYLFKMPMLVNSFFRNSQGLVEDTLNCKYKDFAIVKAHVPQKEEQIVIAKIIQETEQELIQLGRKVDLLKKQKKGLMQILLTGKKRLKVK